MSRQPWLSHASCAAAASETVECPRLQPRMSGPNDRVRPHDRILSSHVVLSTLGLEDARRSRSVSWFKGIASNRLPCSISDSLACFDLCRGTPRCMPFEAVTILHYKARAPLFLLSVSTSYLPLFFCCLHHISICHHASAGHCSWCWL